MDVRLITFFHPLRRFWAPYPLWLRVLLWPLGALVLLLWPISVIFAIPRAAWLWLRKSPPFRQVIALFDLELWRAPQREVPHPYDLLGRSRLARRLLAPVMVLEWMSLVGFGLSVGLLCLLTDAPGFLEQMWVIAFTIMVVAGFPGWVLSSYHNDLVRCWKKLNSPLCPSCGYNRLHAASRRCPECGTLSSPVAAGKMPREWKRWMPLINEWAVFLPFALVGSLAPVLGMASTWISWLPLWAIGALILPLTASFSIVALLAVFQVLWPKRPSARAVS